MGGTRCKHVSQESFEQPVKKDNTVTDFLGGELQYSGVLTPEREPVTGQGNSCAVQCSLWWTANSKAALFSKGQFQHGWRFLKAATPTSLCAPCSTAPAPKHTLLSGFDLSGYQPPVLPFILLIAAQVSVFLPPPLEGECCHSEAHAIQHLGIFCLVLLLRSPLPWETSSAQSMDRVLWWLESFQTPHRKWSEQVKLCVVTAPSQGLPLAVRAGAGTFGLFSHRTLNCYFPNK